MVLQPSDQVTTCDSAYDVRKLCAIGRHSDAAKHIDWPPDLESNDPRLLFTWGVITSATGAATQSRGTQEIAKDLLTKAVRLYGPHPMGPVAEMYLGGCYWRMGDVSSAHALFDHVLQRETCPEARFGSFLFKAIIASEQGDQQQSLKMLGQAEVLLELVPFESRGRFHNHRAIALMEMCGKSESPALRDRAIIEFEAAAYAFEMADAIDLQAAVMNNAAKLYAQAGRFDEAYKQVNQAILLISDNLLVKARMLDQRAQIHLANNKPQQALSDSNRSLALLEKGEQVGVLIESLITQATALARLGKSATVEFERAIDLAIEIGDVFQEHRAMAALMAEVRLPYQRAFELFTLLETSSKDRSVVVSAGAGLQKSLEAMRIRESLVGNDGQISGAARWMGIKHSSLLEKISKHYPGLAVFKRDAQVRRKRIIKRKK